jgi:hypothetical protein
MKPIAFLRKEGCFSILEIGSSDSEIAQHGDPKLRALLFSLNAKFGGFPSIGES